MTTMIDLYFDHTPNGQKVHIMLEECGLPYNLIIIDIGKGEQFDPDFLKISPNNKVPAIIDHEGPNPSPSSNRARSCSTSPKRPAGSCRKNRSSDGT